MPFSFIREQVISQPRDVVEANLARYQPLNYNRFRWWRSHTDNITPLGKRANLKDRIVNGDFNEALYDAFTSHFQITREELENELCEWPGELLSYYNYCNETKRTTPYANRKSRRGRPRKNSVG
mgnify:CR=1 FL=1